LERLVRETDGMLWFQYQSVFLLSFIGDLIFKEQWSLLVAKSPYWSIYQQFGCILIVLHLLF
jgi:hypothetical protein